MCKKEFPYNITASIVVYNNDEVMLRRAIASFQATSFNRKLYLVDNSPSSKLKLLATDTVEYIHNPLNPGFGAGHNIAIKKAICEARYHLILNPDIFFDEGSLEKIIEYLDANENVGILMPKVLYPNGETQYLAKLLPRPFDFIVRRFLPFKKMRQKIDDKFELRKSNYDKIMEVPFLSGCFLVYRTEAFEKVGGFDENIFMYTEDIDLCRRVIQAGYKSIFYPEAVVFHDHVKKSFSDLRTFKVYLRSAIYYFNKWGWFFDRERSNINKTTLSQIKP